MKSVNAQDNLTELEGLKPNLVGLDRPGLREFFASIGEQAYRGDQVMQWIHQRGVRDINAMTNLSKSLRQKLVDEAEIRLLPVIRHQASKDGTQKWLLQLHDGSAIETVFIPEEDRGTLCISSQAGCALNCTFCSTARQGFHRNLDSGEIIAQLLTAQTELGGFEASQRTITNVVMMGMGEPLLNFDNVIRAMNIMLDDFAYGLSKRRVTLSTSGVVPMIDKLKEACPVSLAVSLHAPNDVLRNELVPLNKKYGINTLLAACKRYVDGESRRRVTMEYAMIDSVNDSPAHAKELARCLEGVPSKINLIPFNPFPGTRYQCSAPGNIEKFRDILLKAGYVVVIRRTRGGDIAAACGQLAGQVQDKTNRSTRISEEQAG